MNIDEHKDWCNWQTCKLQKKNLLGLKKWRTCQSAFDGWFDIFTFQYTI